MNTTNPTNPRTTQGGTVRLAELNRYDCWRLVTEAAGPDGIARVVWSGPDGPAIVPVNFTVADGFLWFQTTPGSRLAQESPDQRVLVEVDHVDPASHTGWSVVVTGVATSVSLEDDPGILGDLHVWPGGLRELLLRVEPDELTGRRLLRHD
jgi:uncharacterized protein